MNKLIEKNVMHTKDKLSSSQSVYLPLGINMKDISCLIVGGGRIATRKAKTLLDANASVTILSTSVTDHLHFLADTDRLCWILSKYRPEHLVTHDFIIAATSDRTLNIRIGKDAAKLGKLYCVVSSGQHSKVIFPAIYKNEMLTVAVHSNGTNCRYSKATRNKIAAYIKRPKSSLQKLIMFGFDKAALSREAFSRLRIFESGLAQNNFVKDKLLVLVTCQRWECYIQANSSRQLAREILNEAQKSLGLLWAKCKTNIQYEHEHTAYCHLLNVCLGLDSPLIGETEIAGQVRRAVTKWIDSEKSQIHETFLSILSAAGKIRQSCNLSPAGKSWTSNIISLINKNIGHNNKAKILVVGNGRLSRSLIEKIIASGHTVINFSRHLEEVNTSLSVGYSVYHTNKIVDFLNGADFLVICSELTPEAIDSLKNRKLPFIIDVEGYRDVLHQIDNKSGYISLKEIPQIKLTPRKVGSVANARLKAFEQALIWHSMHNMVKSPTGIIRIGARQSLLSRKQVSEIMGLLRALAEDIKVEKVFIDTPCDRDKHIPLPKVKDDDFFTRDIDQALSAGEIDIAIHSAKDLPQKLPRGLAIAAITPSVAPWECLVSKDNILLSLLPQGARVGTSSIHRKTILNQLRPDIKAVDIRGNVPDRIKQLDAGKYDALVLACAGLVRLELTERITEIFSEKAFPFVAGQGSLALVVRQSDKELQEFLKPLDLGSKEGLPWL